MYRKSSTVSTISKRKDYSNYITEMVSSLQYTQKGTEAKQQQQTKPGK